MTDSLARAAGPTGAGRTRATEPITALEPVTIEGARLIVEFRAHGQIERLEVRQFTPDWLVVEVRGGWAYEHEPMPTKLEVVGGGGQTRRFRCELEFNGWMSVSGNLDGEQLGKARLLLHCERNERAALVRLYRQLRFPALYDRGELDAQRLIELFERSGYSAARGTKLRVSRAWCAANFPPELSVDAVYCGDDGAALGHVSVTRAYSRTWIGHQLTVLDEHRQSTACRVALYDHFATAPILIDAHQQQYVLSYYDRSKPWHQLFFESFVEWFDDRERANLVPFDRFEPIDLHAPTVDLHAPTVDPHAITVDDPRLELDQVKPDELGRAIGLIREQLPPIACAALDIEASMLDRAYLHPDFAAHGIARGRRVFVVREAGELVGVALCETGSEDLSLFNLFNLAQLYFGIRASGAARQALVQFVRCHYRAIGQPHPLLVAPAGAMPDPQHAGLSLVETLGCVIWQGHTLRAYRTFLRSNFQRMCERASEPAKSTSMLDAIYLPRVAQARARLRSDPRLQPLLAGALSPVELLGFLLNFSALSLRVVESAEQQRRAGFACAAAGRDQLGAELCAAAERERERDRLLLDDMFELGNHWQQTLGMRINVELLVHQPPPRSLLRWMDLRERLAGGDTPAALLALELERVQLFASCGPTVLELCARLLDDELCASFVLAASSDSVEVVLTQLQGVLASDPAAAERIAEAGRTSLGLYLDFLADCVELGRELAERAERLRAAPRTQQAEPNATPMRLAVA